MVFDYVAGKQDWLANDLPIEGQLAQSATLGSMAERNIPTCSLADNARDVRNRLTQADDDFVSLSMTHASCSASCEPVPSIMAIDPLIG
jgi:hypothetical protein